MNQLLEVKNNLNDSLNELKHAHNIVIIDIDQLREINDTVVLGIKRFNELNVGFEEFKNHCKKVYKRKLFPGLFRLFVRK